MVSEEMLEHMAVPADPKDREEADCAVLEGYQALYLADLLREWAGYHAEDDQDAAIARAYREDIMERLASALPEKRYISVYVHTEEAAEVLDEAFYTVWKSNAADGGEVNALCREIEAEIGDVVSFLGVRE